MGSQKHLDLAMSELGMREIPGERHNPKVVQMYADAGHPEIDNDETAWCAAAVGSWLERSGIPGTGSLLARSYSDWGEEVSLDHAQAGDIVVLQRGNSSWQGHVGIYIRHTATQILVLGGNQNNEINQSWYKMDRFLNLRRYNGPAPKASKSKLTPELLQKLAPRIGTKMRTELAAAMNEHFLKYGITTPRRIAAFLANTAHETGGYRSLEENLNYSAKRLRQVWPSRFKSTAVAKKYANNPEDLANYVYNRFGNTGKAGYGWKYRGRGLMMTTFVDNYEDVKAVTGIDVVKYPDTLLKPNVAVEAACIYWKKVGGNELADAGRIEDIRKRINGGKHGLSEVISYYKKALPLVKNVDLKNDVAKTTGSIGTAGGAIALAKPEWIIPMIMLAVVAATVYVIIRKKRRDKDVQVAISEVERLENLPDQLVLDLHDDDSVGAA